IRALYVTGVQTCALPISTSPRPIPSERLRLGQVMTAVVAEQVEADLDGIGRGEVVEESRGRARLRRRVDQSEQLRRCLFGQELGGLAEQVRRHGGEELVDPGCLELIRVTVLLGQQRGDAEQQLSGLGRIDLHGEGLAGTGGVDDAWLLEVAGGGGVFDRHRTVASTIALLRNSRLTSRGVVR